MHWLSGCAAKNIANITGTKQAEDEVNFDFDEVEAKEIEKGFTLEYKGSMEPAHGSCLKYQVQQKKFLR